METSWDFLADGRYQQALLTGFYFTLSLSLVCCAASTIGGLIVAASQILGPRWLRRALHVYVNVFRNTPPIVQLFFLYFSLPYVFPADSYPLLYDGRYEFNAAALALSVYGTAFVSEVVRSGIESVPRGQWEAAFDLGLSRIQTLRLVIVRQTVPIVIPSCANEFIGLVKWTAIAMTIAVPELTFQAQKIESELFRGFEAITIVTLVYVTVCLFVGLSMRGLEAWLSPVGLRERN